jgi:hypothetical protein
LEGGDFSQSHKKGGGGGNNSTGFSLLFVDQQYLDDGRVDGKVQPHFSSLDFARAASDLAQMKQLEFVATVGESKTQVKLTEPQGASAGYQVLIDQWLQGTLVKRDQDWTAQPSRNSYEKAIRADIDRDHCLF